MNLGEFSCLGPAAWLSVNGDIAVRTTTAEDWTYIDSLQKADANAVGFLQRRTWDDYVWGGQRNFMTFLCLVQSVPVGYVLLTPGRGVNHPARIQQIVIQQDVRRLEYGTALVDQCVRFCETFERSGIALRCRADLLVGGTPCQAFSVAGKRLSLEDYRGNLSLAFADLFHAGRYRWAVWENVPGVLTTKDNAFGSLLGRLVGSDTPLLPHRGGKWTNAGVVSGPQAVAAWRVLDAQYFGVAQRRRRVFVCVSRGAGNWAAAAALLPVGEGVSRHPPARRQAGEGIAGTFEVGAGGGRRADVAPTTDIGAEDRPRRNQGGSVILSGEGAWPANVAPTLNAAFAEKQGLEDQHINGGAGMFVLDKQVATYSTPAIGDIRADSVEATLSANSGGGGETQNPAFVLDVSHTISAKWSKMSGGTAGGTEINNLVVPHLRPRRLTPKECERLQGFPDGWTLVPWKKGMAPDGPRYKALGNSMAVPVMAYIGKRIQLVESGNA